jgi:hypothetical protein
MVLRDRPINCSFLYYVNYIKIKNTLLTLLPFMPQFLLSLPDDRSMVECRPINREYGLGYLRKRKKKNHEYGLVDRPS